jgi:hypothetical protein
MLFVKNREKGINIAFVLPYCMVVYNTLPDTPGQARYVADLFVE